MTTFKCPKCGIGEMQPEVVTKHDTNLNGVQFEIQDAKIARCSSCGETTVSAKELKRWGSIQHAAMAVSGQLPRPEEVKTIREAVQLTVSEFATLLGVTRQTVHAWERADSSGMTLGPAAILLVLIREELHGKVHGALDALKNMARLRGHDIDPQPRGLEGGVAPDANAARTAVRSRPASAPKFCCGRPAA